MQKLKHIGCSGDHTATEQEWNNNHTNPYYKPDEEIGYKKYICPACTSQLNLEDLESVTE